MRTPRALVATDPRRFGRASGWLTQTGGEHRWGLSDDAQLFGATFVGGFLFVSILIA